MSLLLAAGAAFGINALTSAIGAGGARKERKKAERLARQYEGMINSLEANRQDTINPFDQLTNTFSNLQVATGAAEMQADEQDIALANTLDTLRSSNYSAGGATALAQAASRSKRDIANSIEMQEARNQELMAQGEQRRQEMLGRGRQMQFDAQEQRDNFKLSRYFGLQQQNMGVAANQRSAENAIWAGLGSSTAQMIGGFGMGMGTPGNK